MNKQANKFRHLVLCFLSTSSLFFCTDSVANDQSLNLRLSAGSSWQARNDVQIPNTDTGTRFSLFDTVGSGPVPAIRLEINWLINERHGMRLLLAPLSYTKSVEFDRPINFNEQSFAANETADASYRFNSWRVGYHYSLVNNGVRTFRVGATLKVRDAEIRLQQGGNDSANDDVGFVPLLYLAGSIKLSQSWAIKADLDALAGGPGRAIDVGLALDYKLTRQWNLGAEVRILDGGADVEEVYNFARFNSVALAVSTGF